MLLNEIKYMIFFDYIKDIRRYLYDIETFLKEQNLFSGIVGANNVSDEDDPFLSRLHVIKEFDNKIINIIISQISITIVVQYKNDYSLNHLENEENNINDVVINIRNYLKKLIDGFFVCYESLSIISNNIYTDINNIKILKVDTNQDENRNIISTEVEDELFFIEDTGAYKTYKQTQNIIHPVLIRNKADNFMGWNVVLRREINNRLKYNNAVDSDGELDFDKAINLLNNSLKGK